MATVYGIVKQSGGSIWVYSEPGRRATFKVYFPRVDREPEVQERAEKESATPTGGETILVVEDDETVRRLVQQTLEMKGFRVLAAANGTERLSIAERYQGYIDLLLTDVVMPEIGGRALAELLVAKRPAIEVLYVSGYTDDAVVRHGVLDSHMAFLQKPFTPDALVRKVVELLKR